MDIKDLLIEYKKLLAKAMEDGVILSDIDIMEELGVSVDTLEELKTLKDEDIEIDEDSVRTIYHDEVKKTIQHDLEDEFDLSIDERPYIPEEEEEPVLEEEEVSDEYYEDMNDNQWDEIEAAAEKEAEREREAAEKAAREKKAQSKREYESRKKREEELRRKAEEANKVTSSQQKEDAQPVVAPQPESGTNVESVNVETTTPPTVTTPVVESNFAPVQEPVVIENGNFKSQGFFDNFEPEDYFTTYEKGKLAEEAKRMFEEAQKAVEVKSTPQQETPASPVTPQPQTTSQSDYIPPVVPVVDTKSTETPTPTVPPVTTTPTVDNVAQGTAQSAPQAEAVPSNDTFGTSFESVPPVAEPTKTQEYQYEEHLAPKYEEPGVLKVSVEVPPAYESPNPDVGPTPINHDVGKGPENGTNPIPVEIPIPPVIPAVDAESKTVDGVNINVEVHVPVTEIPISPAYDHNQLVNETENADYSKNHQYEKQEAHQASVASTAASAASNFQKEDSTGSDYKPAEHKSDYTSPVGVVHPGTQNIPQHKESDYYTPAGVPISVENRVPTVEPVYERVSVEPAIGEHDFQREQIQTTFDRVYANYAQDTSILTQHIEEYKAQLADMRERGVSQDIVSAVQADLDYSTHKLQSMQSEKAKVEEAINNGTISATAISYIPTARAMLDDYERETFDITRQINEYKQQMSVLEKEGGSIVEKASLKADIEYYTERLETIKFEKQEILDTMFTSNPAKSIVSEAVIASSLSVYDKDVLDISKQIQDSKAQLAQMRAAGASAAEMANVKSDIDFHSSRLRDIKSESNRVAEAMHNGLLTAESVSFIPVAKSMIDEFDKETWAVTKQLTETKAQLSMMKSEGAPLVDRMDLEKEVDRHVARLQEIKADRKVITDALYEGTAPLKDAIYLNAAKSQLVAYDRETFDITKQLVGAKEELAKLKNNAKTPKEAISKAEGIVTRHQTRLVEIQADRKRVIDFINQGPRKITRDDVANSEYSRNHRMETRENDLKGLENNSRYSTNSRMQQVHKTRMQALAGKVGGKTLTGMKNVGRRIMEEDEDLSHAETISDETTDVIRIAGAFRANSELSKELKRLGLDKMAIQRDLIDIGVVTGVGDVTTMSIKQLKEELVKGGGKLSLAEIHDVLRNGGGLKIPHERQQQLLKSIELKERLQLHNTKIADFATRHAGEYIHYSKKKLLAIIKDENLSIDVRSKAELALQYKKLSKLNAKASSRWSLTKSFAFGLARQLAQNNDYLGDLIGMGNNAKTAYRIGKTTYNVGHRIVTGNRKPPKKLSAKVQKILDEQKNLRAAGSVKTAIKKPTLESLKKAAGIRVQNLVGTSKQAAGAAVKSATTVAQKISAIGTKIVAGAKAAIGVAAKAIAAIAAALGSTAGLILLIVLILCFIVVLICSYVMGDENAKHSIFDRSTSVVEMVEYLEEKNADWIEEIQELTEAQPTTRDKHGDRPPEYTKIHYTYYDAAGNVCMVTDNTKEIISMAAVYFQQDFSDADKVYDYIDELWEKSHILTTSESTVYSCLQPEDQNICFNESGQFNTDAQGFNGHDRKFYCYEDPNAISYNDCYQHDTWNAYRKYVDGLSYRFSNNVNYYTKYDGISNILTENSSMGYGCSESTNTFYCTSIGSIGNSEVLVRMVNETGIPYYTLLSDRGCEQKHTTDSEGSPLSYCYEYSRYYKTFSVGFGDPLPSGYYYDFEWNSSVEMYEWFYIDTEGVKHTMHIPGQGQDPDGQHSGIDSFVLSYSGYEGGYYWYNYSIPYYSCEEKTCPGHSITYHTCNGHDYDMAHTHSCYGGLSLNCPEHIEKVCHGHVDLNVNMEIRGFDGNWLFMTPIEADDGFIWDNESDIEWATALRDQNWKEMYGVEIPSSLFPDSELMGSVILPTHPKALPIPLYNQMDYNTPYGAYGTVASHGCGITCVAMVAAYHKGEDVSPALLGRLFGNYNTQDGSLWTVFADTASELNIPFEKQTSSWAEVVRALENGKPVVSTQNGNGPFTSGGHFILLTGITEDGRILVNDPNGYNYSNPALRYGFANGFTQDQITMGSGGAYWIYGAKETTGN